MAWPTTPAWLLPPNWPVAPSVCELADRREGDGEGLAGREIHRSGRPELHAVRDVHLDPHAGERGVGDVRYLADELLGAGIVSQDKTGTGARAPAGIGEAVPGGGFLSAARTASSTLAAAGTFAAFACAAMLARCLAAGFDCRTGGEEHVGDGEHGRGDVHGHRESDWFTASVALSGGQLLNVSVVPPPGTPPWGWTFVLTFLFSAPVIAAAAVLAARWIARPMRSLAAATSRFGRGEAVDDLPEM